MSNEVEYRELPEFPGYKIGSDGTVWSCIQKGRWGRIFDSVQRQLKTKLHRGGYPMVALGRTKTRTVHSLVAEAFIGPRPEGYQVRHLDGDPSNCRAENLAYGTPGDNWDDCVRHGRNYVRLGSDHPRSKLTESQVLEIVSRHRSGETTAQLARSFNCSYMTIGDIMRGNNWSHLTGIPCKKKKAKRSA